MFCLEIDYVFCIIFSFYSPYPVFLFSYQHCHSELYYKFSTFPKAKRFVFTKKRKTTENGFKTLPHSQRSIFIKSILKFSDHCLALYCVHTCVQLHIRIIISVCNNENTCFLISVCFDLLRIK